MGDIKRRIICSYSNDFILGGIESYYMRMFEWGSTKKYECVLALPKKSKIHNEWKEDIARLGVKSVFYSNMIFSSSLKDEKNEGVFFDQDDENIFITADIHSYLKMQYIKIKNNLNRSKVVLYIMHPYFCRSSKKRWVNRPYEGVMKQLFKGGIVFMDEETSGYCEKFYGISGLQNKIIRLGIFVKHWSRDEIVKKIDQASKYTILTICRMDFPFKGYVCGLIDVYSELKERFPQIELIVIGDGPDKDVLLDKVELLDDNKKKDLHLIGGVAYEKLQYYFDKTKVYVGMGTTLLDASNEGVVSIVSTAYKMEALTSGVFSQSYNNVGGNEALCDGKLQSIEDVLVSIIEAEDKKYIDLSKACHDVVLEFYNIDISMEKLLSIDDKVNIPSMRFLALRFYDAIVFKVQNMGIG